ncbi:filaggrin-2-like [Gopherus flavomarginatus]|uniref:filaggrin-2-like n=1 Tax=Gopherus flavomarginatus TaxID=286002 RepID=UPI0021CBBE1D|nr:filaggrin-2-like [Gopherus flavomarginatus]
MPQLLDSISTIISVFYKHGKKDEDSSTISKREVKRFIQREFADITVNPFDVHTIEAVLQLLDHDGDAVIDFNEFLLLIFRVVKVCYWHLQPKRCLPQRTETGLSGERCQEPEANLNREGMKASAMKHVSLNLGRKKDATLSHVSLNHERMRGVAVSHLSMDLSHLSSHGNLSHEGMRGPTMRDVILKQGR